ncbi:MAG: DNA translocase FtsK 4TM domain-containing protein [Syntrophorhabdaceae bacterium]|nr:DNA translocase FtsK 4TM domain-containing protein [Syntrophorhabdaceae bacterium]
MTRFKRDSMAILFLTVGLYLSLSLVSFHQHDPSLSSASIPETPALNWGGKVGAVLADLLIQVFGIGAIAFPFLCIMLAVWSFRGGDMLDHRKRAAGGLLAVCSVLGILSFFAGHVSVFGQNIYLPGVVGELLGKQLLGRLLSTAGGLLLLFATLLLSLMLMTGAPLSGLPGFWRREEKHSDKVRAMVKEKLVPKEPWEIEEESLLRKEAAMEAARPKVIPPRPADEEASVRRAAGEAFVLPLLDLLEPSKEQEGKPDDSTLRENARALLSKLTEHGIDGSITEIQAGPLVTMYEFKPAPGVKANRVSSMAGDLALAMRCESVRVVPNIPGKGVMGFEIPNAHRSSIVLREMLGSAAYVSAPFTLALALGKDIFGDPVVRDLAKMPHLLIAGATGSGKSVALHTMILSILFRATPEDVRLILVDPKMLELSLYEDIPHLYHPVVTQPREAALVLKWAVGEMRGRYQLMMENGVRNIDAFNQLAGKRQRTEGWVKGQGEGEDIARLPYIVIIIDELADLMMTTASKREVEDSITQLTQMARAAGIHLIFATQRPSVDVLTGIIKANFPSRVSFKVTSQIDSRTILDQGGAETLLGFGDMLFLQPGVTGIMRVHGPYVSEEEIYRVVGHLKAQGAPIFDSAITTPSFMEEPDSFRDEMFDAAVEEVCRSGRASVSFLQRRLKIGFNRAARIIEEMERQGIIGPAEGGKQREVFMLRREE